MKRRIGRLDSKGEYQGEAGELVIAKHNHPPNFGRRVDGCPRCEQLKAGAKPIEWNDAKKAREAEQFRRELARHDCKKSNCGPVCTFGDW